MNLEKCWELMICLLNSLLDSSRSNIISFGIQCMQRSVSFHEDPKSGSRVKTHQQHNYFKSKILEASFKEEEEQELLRGKFVSVVSRCLELSHWLLNILWKHDWNRLKQLHLNRLGCEHLYEDMEVLLQVQCVLAASCINMNSAERHTSCALLLHIQQQSVWIWTRLSFWSQSFPSLPVEWINLLRCCLCDTSGWELAAWNCWFGLLTWVHE